MARPFLLYKSSAGSGKTYTLTLEYLKLTLQDPKAGFKGILAVTFTNKATQEMKERILKELGRLSKEVKPEESMDQALLRHLKLTPEQLMERAEQVLRSILHGYGHFSVSTIDSFFQKVIRSFARELDLQAKFDVEMDTDNVLELLVDRIVEKVAEDPHLRQWLISYAEHQLLDGKSWDIRGGIKDLGKEIFQERFKAHRRVFQESVAQEGFLLDFKQEIQAAKNRILAESQSKRQEAEQIRLRQGLNWEDFKGGSKGFAMKFPRQGNPKNPIPELTKKMMEELPDPMHWFSKGSPQENQIRAAFHEGLGSMLATWPTQLKLWNTYVALQKNLNAFGVFKNLILELRDLKDEEGILLISDVNDFLTEITKDNEAPFIYEKIGNQYQHFLIDEFQDTSEFQWSSFKPLLENSLASGHTNLLVGDVKQSIYRWRGGKLELLLSEVQTHMRDELIEQRNLDVNYRSLPGIIRFNNSLFEHLPAFMQRGIEQYAMDPQSILTQAFQDVAQRVPDGKLHSPFQGKIHIAFTEKNNSPSAAEDEELEEEEADLGVLEKLPDLVMKLQDQGYALKDIAFLVQKNAQGAVIADTLMEYQRTQSQEGYRFDVLSEESLFIDKSIAVKCVLGLLTYFSNTADKVALKTFWQYYALVYGIPVSHELFHHRSLPEDLLEKQEELLRKQADLLQLPLLELVEQAISFIGLTEHRQDLAHLSGFKEAVLDFVKKNRADLRGFLEWWDRNKLKRTVRIPEDHDAMRILTIHKAKGLQFKVVIAPYLDWEIVPSGTKAPILWAPFATEQGIETVIPLTHQKSMKQSNFSELYEKEVRLAYLDSLNMLYVAFTRAEEAIFGFANYFIPKTNGPSLKTTGNVLYELFSTGFTLGNQPNPSWNSAINTFDWGEFPEKKRERTPQVQQEASLRWEYQDWSQKLKTKSQAWDFSEEGIRAREQRDVGVIVHELLATSKSLSDALLLLQKFTFEGRWVEDIASEIAIPLKRLFESSQVQSWFDPKAYSLTEQGILLPGGMQKRPDRILLGKEEVVVIDFKTGAKKEEHPRQVQEYMDLVKALTHLPVTGFVCYLQPLEIVEV
ncbi:MAG: hypothetical protein RL407_1439 [Bacteroidota bacterium]